MYARTTVLVIIIIAFTLSLIGCGDEDFKSGQYWLKKENNWQMAAKYFRASLVKNPDRWKTHEALIKALGQGNDELAMETQLRSTLAHFPDSARSKILSSPGVKILGEERYNRIAANIEQYHLSNLLATQKGNRPDLLSRGIMAACRAKDTTTVMDYFERLLSSLAGEPIPDSVRQEMNFFIGPAMVTWVQHESGISKNPNNIQARLSQLDAGLIMGDVTLLKRKLKDLYNITPEATTDPLVVKKYGVAVGADPFASKQLVTGWDGSYSPNGENLIYVKDVGNENNTDVYIYRSSSNGSNNIPLFKAVQNRLSSIAIPVYSPDSKWIYFYGSSEKNWNPERTGRFYLYRVKPQNGSRPEKLTDAKLLATPPYFSKDGSIMLVKRDVGSLKSSVQIVRLDTKTQKLTTISRISEPVIGATFNSQGDSLIFSTDRGIFRRSIDGSAISVDLNWRNIRSPMLSPDGKWLAMIGTNDQLLALNRDENQLYWLGLISKPAVSFSSDGKLLVTQSVDGKNKVISLDLNNKVNVAQFGKQLAK